MNLLDSQASRFAVRSFQATYEFFAHRQISGEA